MDHGLSLVSFVDVNWGADQRSTTGFCVSFGGNPVAWRFKKQRIASHFTFEATTQIVWLESLFGELQISLAVITQEQQLLLPILCCISNLNVLNWICFHSREGSSWKFGCWSGA